MNLKRYINYETTTLCKTSKLRKCYESLNVYENYASITPGGVSLGILEEDFGKVLDFISSLNVRFEITEEHLSKVTAKIVENLRNISVISGEKETKTEEK